MNIKCATKNCRKPAKRGKHCYSCKQNRYKENNPEYYAFYVMKNNAKRRGKIFKITFEDFLEVVVPAKYMKGKGRTANSLHLDRIREEECYVKGNIQVLKNKKNVQKFLHWKYDEKGKPTGYKVSKRVEVSEEGHPF